MFEEDLDQLVHMAQFKWHSRQCHNPARGLHQQAILWCIKPQWMCVVDLRAAPFNDAPGDGLLLRNALEPIVSQSTLDQGSIEDADSLAPPRRTINCDWVAGAVQKATPSIHQRWLVAEGWRDTDKPTSDAFGCCTPKPQC